MGPKRYHRRLVTEFVYLLFLALFLIIIDKADTAFRLNSGTRVFVFGEMSSWNNV